MFYVYGLKCSKGSYIGCTNNLKSRLIRHNKGQVNYTRDKLPVSLIFYIAVNDKNKAYKLEKYLKSGTGRVFIKKRL